MSRHSVTHEGGIKNISKKCHVLFEWPLIENNWLLRDEDMTSNHIKTICDVINGWPEKEHTYVAIPQTK